MQRHEKQMQRAESRLDPGVSVLGGYQKHLNIEPILDIIIKSMLNFFGVIMVL